VNNSWPVCSVGIDSNPEDKRRKAKGVKTICRHVKRGHQAVISPDTATRPSCLPVENNLLDWANNATRSAKMSISGAAGCFFDDTNRNLFGR
jgi:hypothetical protein